MSLYAVVLICAAMNPCTEETSLREIIAPIPSPDERSCFLSADNMRAKAVRDPSEVAVAFCRVVPETNGSRFGGARGAPAAVGHSGPSPGVGGDAAHSSGN